MRILSQALHKLCPRRPGSFFFAVLRFGLPAVAAYAVLLCFFLTGDDPVRTLFLRHILLDGFHAAWSALAVVVLGAVCADCVQDQYGTDEK